MPNTNLITVITTPVSIAADEDIREVNFAHRKTRAWLEKHIMWAVSNQREVTIYKSDEGEASCDSE